MRHHLLPNDCEDYRVNMHSHSTCSDGSFTPEEIKAMYVEKGYSAVAFTEHRELFDFSRLNDDRFIAIKSYEIDFSSQNPPLVLPINGTPQIYDYETMHINLYAKDPERAQAIDLSDLSDFSIDNINEAIRRAAAAGFIAVYNHPHWSLNTHETYTALEGLTGLELVNGASQRSSDMDYTPHVYNEMARAGKRLCVVGGDDNHVAHHMFLAWTVVKAKALSHRALIEAIEAGNCYASSGPVIEALYVEDGAVHVHTSEAAGIFYTTPGRKKAARLSEGGAPLVTEATFPLMPGQPCFRITVRDAAGRHANTRFYYPEEWQK